MSVRAHDLNRRERTEDVQGDRTHKFSDLGLSDPILKGLSEAGFVVPSPIQWQAIPLGRSGLGD